MYKIFLFFTILYKTFGQGPPVTVYTTRGTVVGYHYDQGNDTSQTWYGIADLFLGIPYALAPVGNLRFKQPRPLLQFPGPTPYNATYFRSSCIQPSGNENSEDCLFVNVFTPNAAATTKYPVMLWIHGGGLIGGDSHFNVGELIRNLVSKGVVVASLDYRMSWLGYFTTFTDDFPPNLGMLDQVMAIKFVKEEISYFGGDPNRITIFGESAGGHSVSSHTYSPLSQNLFQGVIMESGTVLCCYEDSVGPTNRNFRFAQHACNYTQDMWDAKNFGPLTECLMNISVADGLKALQSDGAGNSVCWNMVQDNFFFPGNPQSLWQKRPNIPAIIGNCKDEYALWIMGEVINNVNLTGFTRQSVEANLQRQYSTWFGNETQGSAVIKIWEDNYLPTGTADDDHLAWLQFTVDVGTPAYFTKGSLKDVEYYLQNKNPNVYAYQFAWSSPINNRGNPLPNWHPVPHVCEIPYVFTYGSGGSWDATNQKIANFVQEIWTNFAKTGKPTTDGSWKPAMSADFTKLEYFEINNVSSAKIGYREKDEIAWNQQIPKVMGDYPPNLVDSFPVCSHGYTSKVTPNKCYEAFGTVLSFTDAQNACVQNSFGNLVSVGSAFENSDLLAYAKNAFPTCTGFYTGLFRSTVIPSNMNWTWVNYDPSTFRGWKSGFPNQESNANCVVLNANDGSWTNQDCTTSQCYVCGYI